MTARTIVVTGASRGIGACLARGLAADGHRVALVARSAEPLKALAEEVGGLAVPLDLLDLETLPAALAHIEARLGPVEALINNAGIACSAPLAKTTDADFARTMALNVEAPFRLCRALVPGMVERGWGRVVFVASAAGLTGFSYTSAYCASKHAVIGLNRALAAEHAKTGVTFNAVCPGFVDTPMTDQSVQNIVRATGRTPEQARRALERISAQDRLIQPDEVLHATRTFLSDAAYGITGQALVVDGGTVLH